MNKINEIVFAPHILKAILHRLDNKLIIHHIQEFKKLFPDIKPINKHHYLTNYSRKIDLLSCLRSRSCFKYEAYHLKFKKYDGICGNYLNETLSIMSISQIGQCATWATNKSPIREKVYCTRYKFVLVKRS